MRRIQQFVRLTAMTFTTLAVLGTGIVVQPALAKGPDAGHTIVRKTGQQNAKVKMHKDVTNRADRTTSRDAQLFEQMYQDR